MSLYPNKTGPAVGTFERLEPRARKREFHETLRGEMHDPMWILTQQWRVGEFNAEDAGSVVKARVMLTSAKLDLFEGPNSGVINYDHNTPLEAKVEQLPLIHDLSTRMQLGNKWLKLLRKNGLSGSYDALFLAAFPITETGTPEEQANTKSGQVRSVMTGRTPDGEALINWLQDSNSAKNLTSGSLSVDSGDYAAMDQVEADFLAWYSALYYQPQSTDELCWNDNRLEYSFKCSAPNSLIPAFPSQTLSEEDVFSADEYQKGKLDWYSLDVKDQNNLDLDQITTANTDSVVSEVSSFIPTNISAKGMPTKQWWEMEDEGIDLANMLSRRNEISKLVLTQFAVNYSNDWFIIPNTREVGNINKVANLMTTDVFGKSLLIDSANTGLDESWETWGMFAHEGDSKGEISMFAPTIIKNVESEPIEKVFFLRDEMSNMVWGVEEVIPDDLGGGRPGKDAFQELEEYLTSLYQYVSDDQPDNYVETGAPVKFQLGTTVPEYWIPFIPVGDGSGSGMMLQRAAMARFIKGLDLVHTNNVVRPRTSLLSVGIDQGQPYKIHEEEVLKAGISVTTHYQRTRWFDGSTFVWLGRRKRTGKGTGESGLIFDQIIPSTEIDTAD